MEWTNEFALQLIDEYKKHPLLWDSRHEYHYSRNKKIDAWDAIGKNLKLHVSEVKQKMNSLLGSFRREKAKRRRSESEKGYCQIYNSQWYAFNRMQFLLDKDEHKTEMNTDNTNSDKEDTQYSEAEESETLLNPYLMVKMESPTPCDRVTPPGPPRKKVKAMSAKQIEDPWLNEAFGTSKESSTKAPSLDAFSVYGQHIANKLRNYSRNTQIEVEHAFNNILYQADRGIYDCPDQQNQFYTSMPQFPTNNCSDELPTSPATSTTSKVSTSAVSTSACSTPYVKQESI